MRSLDAQLPEEPQRGNSDSANSRSSSLDATEAAAAARQYNCNLERALAVSSSLTQPLPCRRRLELLVLAKVKAQLHQIGERSDNDDDVSEANCAQASKHKLHTMAIISNFSLKIKAKV